jgi:hypothetical protein
VTPTPVRTAQRILPVARLWLAVVMAGIAATLIAAPLHADQGVRISLGMVAVNDPLAAGGTYSLPDLVVSNPGNERADYQMLVFQVTGQAELSVEQSWVSFSPASFSLAPGATQTVAMRLVIPADASPGSYMGYLKSQLVPSASAVSIGPAAAAKLTFTIAPSGVVDGLVSAVRGFLAATAPWPIVLLALLAVLIVVRMARRRWSFRVERRS